MQRQETKGLTRSKKYYVFDVYCYIQKFIHNHLYIKKKQPLTT